MTEVLGTVVLSAVQWATLDMALMQVLGHVAYIGDEGSFWHSCVVNHFSCALAMTMIQILDAVVWSAVPRAISAKYGEST